MLHFPPHHSKLGTSNVSRIKPFNCLIALSVNFHGLVWIAWGRAEFTFHFTSVSSSDLLTVFSPTTQMSLRPRAPGMQLYALKQYPASIAGVITHSSLCLFASFSSCHINHCTPKPPYIPIHSSTTSCSLFSLSGQNKSAILVFPRFA